MVSKGRHPKNPINRALDSLGDGFEIVTIHKSHRWGSARCTTCGAEVSIWSTPKVPEHNAQQIIKFAARHNH